MGTAAAVEEGKGGGGGGGEFDAETGVVGVGTETAAEEAGEKRAAEAEEGSVVGRVEEADAAGGAGGGVSIAEEAKEVEEDSRSFCGGESVFAVATNGGESIVCSFPAFAACFPLASSLFSPSVLIPPLAMGLLPVPAPALSFIGRIGPVFLSVIPHLFGPARLPPCPCKRPTESFEGRTGERERIAAR